jgi:FAD/FMN-containing dehydrogenase
MSVHEHEKELSALPGYQNGDRSGYETPYRGPRGHSCAVVTPSTVEEVQTVLAWAQKRNIRVLPQGANSGLSGTSTATNETTLILSLERLCTPCVVDPIEGTATVAAGVRRSTLATAAAQHGLFLPIDLAVDASIGGMVATNAGGSRALRYGTMRQHVLGVEAVLADADTQIFRGRTLRKDARGFDLSSLFIGSSGTLGVLTQMTLSLTPIPAQQETWWIALVPGKEIELFRFLQSQTQTISAFELLSQAAINCSGLPSPFDNTGDIALVEWSETSPCPQDRIALFAVAKAKGLLLDTQEISPASAWKFRHDIPRALSRRGSVIAHDIAVPRNKIPELRLFASGVAKKYPSLILCDFGHIGDGGVHINFFTEETISADDPRRHEQALDDYIAPFGTYSAEHGLGPTTAQRWLNETPTVEKDIVRSVKTYCDPQGILGHPDHPYNML